MRSITVEYLRIVIDLDHLANERFRREFLTTGVAAPVVIETPEQLEEARRG